MRGRLDESHDIALGVFHLKPKAAVRAVFDASWYLDFVCRKVEAKRLRVGSDVSQVVQTGGRVTGRQRQDFDKLGRIHIVADAAGILGVRALEKTDVVDVIAFGCLGITGVNGNVRDAGDGGPRLGSGNKRKRERNIKPRKRFIQDLGQKTAGEPYQDNRFSTIGKCLTRKGGEPVQECLA